MSVTYEEKYFISRNPVLMRAYLYLKSRINGFLAYVRLQIISKSRITICTRPKEIIDCFQLLKPKNYEGPVQRIGGDSDGGYVIPKLQYMGVVSPGTGNHFEFENHFAQNGVNVICIDGSVSRPEDLFPTAIFIEKFLAKSADLNTEVSLSEIVENFFPLSHNLLLQCDIEGAEWDIFVNCDRELLSRFAVITLEIHYLNRLLDRVFLENFYLNFISKFQDKFVVINCHPNNAGEDFYIGLRRYPEILELTLINRDLYLGNHRLENSLESFNRPNVRYKKVRTYHFLK